MSTATIVEHKKCICVEFGDTNNNKVWQYTIYNDGTALTEWGRVGKALQSKMTTASIAHKKWDEKTNADNKPDKRYTEVKAVDTGGSISVSSIKDAALKDIARKQIKSSNPIVADLIEFLVKVNAHNIFQASGGRIQYDTSTATFKTPLGVIAPEQVDEARVLLSDLGNFVAHQNFGQIALEKLNQYLRLIPHDVGMKKITPVMILPDLAAVQKENDLLDGLATSFINVTEVKPDKKTVKKVDDPQIFQVDMDIVNDRAEINRINSYYEKTKKTMHQSCHYKLKQVYSVHIKSEKEAFEKYGRPIANVMELFHGSKCSNLISIFRQGLIIPPSSSPHCTGRLGGDGIYGTDISSKALNYATNFWNGGGKTDRIFMFLCDFAMGKMYRSKGYGDYKTHRDGYDSTFMEGGKYGLSNNEMIVYKTSQVNLKYLIEFK